MTEADGSTDTYGYDALYRLTSESRTGTGAGSNTYGYDPAGNLTSIGGTPLAYDAANKITTYDTHNTNFFTYDTDGNQVRDVLNGTSYGWDDRGNLTSRSIGSNGVVYAYGYNASGQRVHTVFTVSGQPVSSNTFYVYDGDKVLGEVSSVGVVTAAYTWGADGLVSERLPTASPAKSLWYQYGPQGETRALTNSIGQVADSYSYTAYGKSVSASTNDANPFQYGGKFGYYSEYNGAVLCGHRWYDTHDTLRWLSRDSIGYGGGDNLYAYCRDNPIKWNDPDGTQVYQEAQAAAAAAAAAYAAAAAAAAVVAKWFHDHPPGPIYFNPPWAHPLPPVMAVPPKKTVLPESPTESPGPDWEWRGGPNPKGGWFNPKTDESAHPDFNHPPPEPPHWDYKPDRKADKIRVRPGGNPDCFGPAF